VTSYATADFGHDFMTSATGKTLYSITFKCFVGFAFLPNIFPL